MHGETVKFYKSQFIRRATEKYVCPTGAYNMHFFMTAFSSILYTYKSRVVR